MAILKDVLKIKPLQGIVIDPDDVDLQYSFNHSGKSFAEDLKVVVYQIRHDNRDVFFFELTFAEIPLDSGEERSDKNVENVFLEVSFAPELLRDLLDFNLQSSVVLTRIDQVTSEPIRVQKVSWQTWTDGKLALSSDETTPKYFFDGLGVPIFGQLN